VRVLRIEQEGLDFGRERDGEISREEGHQRVALPILLDGLSRHRIEDVALGDRASIGIPGERQDITVKVQIEAVLTDEAHQGPHLGPVALVAHRGDRGEEGLHLVDVLSGHPMDADVGDALAVGVVDLPLRKRGVEEADAYLEAHRRGDADEGARLHHLLCSPDGVVVDRPDDAQAGFVRRPGRRGRFVGTERVGGVHVVVHLLAHRALNLARSRELSELLCGLEP